jgi:hypothetical protein
MKLPDELRYSRPEPLLSGAVSPSTGATAVARSLSGVSHAGQGSLRWR